MGLFGFAIPRTKRRWSPPNLHSAGWIDPDNLLKTRRTTSPCQSRDGLLCPGVSPITTHFPSQKSALVCCSSRKGFSRCPAFLHAEARGTPAPRERETFLICKRGSMTIVLDDGIHVQKILPDSPTEGLHRPAVTGGQHYSHFPDALRSAPLFGPGDAHCAIEGHKEFPELRRNS